MKRSINFGAMLLASISPALAQSPAAEGTGPSNLRLAAHVATELSDITFASESAIAFVVRESDQDEDLDGDGSITNHSIVHILDRASGEVFNTQRRVALSFLGGLSWPIEVDGPFVFLRAAEAGIDDLNLDGDFNDVVMCVFDSSVGAQLGKAWATPNWPFAIRETTLAFDGTSLLFQLDEAAEGLDLDEDTVERAVWARLDINAETVTPTGVAGFGFGALGSADGSSALLRTSESVQAADANGDGDQLDEVYALYDFGAATATLLPVSLPGGASSAQLFDDGRFLFAAEADDLGVPTPPLANVYAPALVDPSTGAIETRELLVNRTVAHLGIAIYGSVDEDELNGAQMGDLNGDGDDDDTLLRASTGPGVAPIVLGAVISGEPTTIQLGGLIFRRHEPSDGGLDRNGDGDALDSVYSAWVPGLAQGYDLGLASDGLTIPDDEGVASAQDFVLLAVDESAQGDADLNGDGEVAGQVWFSINRLTLATANTGVRAVDNAVPILDGMMLQSTTIDAPFAPSYVGRDFYFYTLATQSAFDLSLSGSDAIALPGGGVLFTLEEVRSGDLNADGDAIDVIYQVYDTAN